MPKKAQARKRARAVSSEIESTLEIYKAEPRSNLDLDSIRHHSSDRCFMLGMEFFAIRIAFMTFDARRFERKIHLENKLRIMHIAKEHGWHAEYVEGGNGWCVLVAQRLTEIGRDLTEEDGGEFEADADQEDDDGDAPA